MTARDDLADAIRGGYEAESQAPTQQEIDALLDRHRDEVRREAVDLIEEHRAGLFNRWEISLDGWRGMRIASSVIEPPEEARDGE